MSGPFYLVTISLDDSNVLGFIALTSCADLELYRLAFFE